MLFARLIVTAVLLIVVIVALLLGLDATIGAPALTFLLGTLVPPSIPTRHS